MRRPPTGKPLHLPYFCFSKLNLDLFPIFGNNAALFDSFAGNKEIISPHAVFCRHIDYGRRGREAVVDPEITRREVVSRVASGEYKNISFIHEKPIGPSRM